VTLDVLTLWIVAGGIAAITLSILLAQEVGALFGERRRPTPPSDELTPWGDVPQVPGGLHQHPFSKRGVQDHDA
jgi:hypothetical protein